MLAVRPSIDTNDDGHRKVDKRLIIDLYWLIIRHYIIISVN